LSYRIRFACPLSTPLGSKSAWREGR